MEINVETVVIPSDQRETSHAQVSMLAEKMRREGFNPSYPITVVRQDGRVILVDGGHRIAAARQVGIAEVPYLELPEGISRIRHSIRCNSDGADTRPDDVFDYAGRIAALSRVGWTGQQIAEELGWGSAAKVTYYGNVKALLHPLAWTNARNGLTRSDGDVNAEDASDVNRELTSVNWSESHFRALLQHLPCPNGDRAMMRAQVAVIHAAQERVTQGDKRFGQTEKKVTAKWIEGEAKKHAWYVKLARYATDTLVQRVKLRSRVDLLTSARQGVYGNVETPDNWDKFCKAVARLNEDALGVTLFQGDCLQIIPTIPDGSVQLVVTDPPYNVTDHAWDRIGNDEDYIEFTRAWLTALRPKLAADYHLFMFCDPEYQARIEELLTADGWPLQSRIIWSNRSLPSGRQASQRFVRTWQMLFHCGTHDLNWSPEWSDERFDVQVFAAPNANTNDGGWHPTPKPVTMLERLVRLGSKPADVVLDPFAGGGSTGEACAHVRQRRCILIERDQDFCNAITKRLSIQADKG